MKNLFLFLLTMLVLGFTACVKVTDLPPTQLKITVVDNSGNVVQGASVTLYETQQDYLNSTHAVVSGVADANGNVYFTNLSPIVYYYYIESGSLNNDFTTNHFGSPLTPNVLNIYPAITIDIPPPTQLKIKVVDDGGNPIAGASVTLYRSKADFINNTNPVATTVTDAHGYMFFSNLSPISYYYYIQDDCLDNYNGNTHLSEALSPNVLNTYDPITISSVGIIKLINNSSDPYEVKLDGAVVLSSLQGSIASKIDEVPAGAHTIEVVQLNGPNDIIISNVDVICGTTTVVNFP